MNQSKQQADFVEFIDSIDLQDIIDSEEFDAAARLATEAEHNLSFSQAFRRYPTGALWAMAIAFTIVMEGYDTILMSNFFAYPQFKKKYGTYYSDLDQYVISARWQIALGDASTCGAFVGLLVNGLVTERYGHRKVTIVGLLVLSAFIFLTFFAKNVQMLVAGQVLAGTTWGTFAIMGSSYASEVCPLALRGFLTSFVNICWVIGQLIAAGVMQGLVDNTTEWAYRIPFAIQWAWPVPLIMVAYFAPDSPWWLVRKGRLEDAEKSLARLSTKVSRAENRLKLAMMVHTNKLEVALKTNSSFMDCFRASNLRRTEIACMVLSAQSLSGEAFAYGSTYFFTQAGFSASNAYKLNFGGYALAFVATCLSWVLMSWYGRRSMIIGGLGFMTLILLLIGVLSYPAVTNVNASWAQAALTLLWLGVYSATLGPQSFALAAEVSATRVRSQTISIARNCYNVVQIVTNTVEPYLINPTEANLKGKTGFVWMGISFLTLLWCIFRLPETKGLTYEELDILFENKVPAWRFKSTEVDIIRDTSNITGAGNPEKEELAVDEERATSK